MLPQALRVIIPPTTSQFLNLLKNSSLAVAIGYPDLISITNTTLNQTGQAIEAIALAMAVYLAISLTMSLAMNVVQRARSSGAEAAAHDGDRSASLASLSARADVSRSHERDRHRRPGRAVCVPRVPVRQAGRS